MGGLLVMSINFQESKRIENQLKGRAGRQVPDLPRVACSLLESRDRQLSRVIATFHHCVPSHGSMLCWILSMQEHMRSSCISELSGVCCREIQGRR